jgi:hypothetical protein
MRPLPDTVFSGLINHQPAETECSRQEPMLYWHLTGAYRALYTRNVTENEDDDDRKHHSREQKPILCLLVEQRRLLENRQTSCTRSQQIENLHDNQRNEVDTASGVDLLVDKVGCKRRLICAILQPHGSKRYALLFEPPECHGEGQEAFKQTDHEIGVEDEACVHKAVLARVAGRAKHEICFGLLVGEGNGGCTVGKTADNDL